MRVLLAIVAALLLVGCADLKDLKDFSVADAKQAQQWAIEDKDIIAAMCYGTLIDVLSDPKYSAQLDRKPTGLLSKDYLVHHTRELVDGVGNSELVDKLRIGCGPYLLEKRDALIKLGIKVAPFSP